MMGSLQLRLSLALALTIALFGLLGGVYAYRSAYAEAEELQDDTLRQIAALVVQQDRGAGLQPGAGRLTDGEEDPRLLISRYDRGPDALLPLPAGLPDGFGVHGVAGVPYRVLIVSGARGQRLAFAQRVSFRDEIARDSAKRSLLPLAVLVPAFLLLIPALVRHTFRPVDRVSHEITARAAADIRPIGADDLPSEVRPFATAINALLQRVEATMAQQRRFIADAAHELRSPLAALSLQAERLACTELSEEAAARLATMAGGIARNRRLIDQLLDMARAQATAQREASVTPSVRAIMREVIEEAMPLAMARNVDLGIEGEEDASLLIDPLDMRIALRNLVHNAIRHSPDGGRVDLAIDQHGRQTIVSVSDQGDGIAESEIAKVTEPFYRIAGSQGGGAGLGLSIVSAIAARSDAALRLVNRTEPRTRGLRAELVCERSSQLEPVKRR